MAAPVMVSEQANLNYREWSRIQRLGRKKVTKASIDPIAKAVLEDEISRPFPSLEKAFLKTSSLSDGRPLNGPGPSPGPPTLPAFLFTRSVSASDVVSNALTKAMGAIETSRHQRGPSFLALPLEIRKMIYSYVADYPTSQSMFDSYYRYNKSEVVGSTDKGFPHYHTPTVLLLCKQITREALPVLRARPFVLDRIPPWVPGHSFPLPLTDFITPKTLCSIRFFEILITLGQGYYIAGVWRRILNQLLDVWGKGNAVARVCVMFKICNLDYRDMWYTWELREHEQLVDIVSCFQLTPEAQHLLAMILGLSMCRWCCKGGYMLTVVDQLVWIHTL